MHLHFHEAAMAFDAKIVIPTISEFNSEKEKH
jgi:hypothetical protein